MNTRVWKNNYFKAHKKRVKKLRKRVGSIWLSTSTGDWYIFNDYFRWALLPNKNV